MMITSFDTLKRIFKPVNIYNLYYFKPVSGFSLDSRSIKRGEGFIAIKGKHFDGHEFINSAVDKGASFIVAQRYCPCSPKVPFFVVEDTLCSLSAAARYIRKNKKPLVYGITGSVGKTTTKEMLSFLLSPYSKVLKNKGTENNILGVAKTIFSLNDEKAMVLELGTNAKGEIESLAGMSVPDIGVITFVKPVHLEGLGSLKGVFEEKMSILKANPNMKLALNRDDPYLSKAKNIRNVYWFGRGKNNDVFASFKGKQKGRCIFAVQGKYELSMPFYLRGFISNFLASILAARLSGIALKEAVERINEFKDYLPMRMEMQSLRGFSILNDAYNSNPYSFKEALAVLKKVPLPKVAVIGDMLELGNESINYHRQLAPQILKCGFEYCLTFGEHSFHLNNKLSDLGYKKAFHFSSHEAIAEFIEKKIGTGRGKEKRCLIFLKGSRKMKLEKVVEFLKCDS